MSVVFNGIPLLVILLEKVSEQSRQGMKFMDKVIPNMKPAINSKIINTNKRLQL